MATSKRTKTSNKPSLKSQGARYSTTNRKGETSYFKSSSDAEKGTAASISKVNAQGNAIPLEAMQRTDVPTVPDKPQVADVGVTTLLSDPANGLNVKDNQYVYDPKISEAENAVAQTNQQQGFNLQNVLSFIGKPQDQEPILAKLEKDAKIRQKEEAVNQYTSSLNNIVAKQQQDLLQLRGTGSQQGVTEAVYGGQQATINREAAIQALPVQAALSAAQGNLEMAQKQVDRLFAIKSADIDRQYKYRSDVGNAVLSFANESQNRVLTAKLADIKEKKDTAQANINYLRQLSAEARDNGNGAQLAQLANVDPSSATFEQDVARIAQGIVKPKAPAASPWELKEVNGKSAWVNKDTQEVKPIGSNPLGAKSELAVVDENINRLNSLLSNTAGIKGSSGNYQPDLIGNFFTGSLNGVTPEDGLIANLVKYTPVIGNLVGANVATNKKNDFLTGVSYIVNNQTFDKLTQLKEGGATFGALSDSERVAIGRAASDLAASVKTDESGNVIGFRGSEKQLTQNLIKVMEGFKAQRDQINIENGVPEQDIQEGYSYWSTLPNYSVNSYSR